ncbi:MAG: 16S rRNA (cytosine(1402)-N(4))-methyltransferase RsmH [Clostridia bacterium]|nr:16S rRNA (cytosine(1402)-N(4))-methyltransferase RsmH [Clostridia bacterium]
MEFKHYSVMLSECIEGLNIKSDGIYVDGTLGGGGHSIEIAKRLDKGKLICVDQDIDAINASKERLKDYLDRIIFVKSNFSEIKNILNDLKIEKIDGMLMDLGVSSYQLDCAERGFSYNADAPLDMRMDKDSEKTAHYVINNYEKDALTRIIRNYGEENFASKISEYIVNARKTKEIETTGELVEIIKNAIPAKARRNGPHPAKRTFQAIRIEVNNELGVIDKTIFDVEPYLREGGRIVIISFHSLEDRIVKNSYKELASGCQCPRDFPVCVCGKKPKVEIITRKPILPSEKELDENPRSRSAKVRICEKL